MRVFITGATGFVGQAVTPRLIEMGHQVTAWVRDESRARQLLGGGVTMAPAANPAALKNSIGQADAVINLAGEPVVGRRWTRQRKQSIVESRVGVTRAIVDEIEASSPRPSVLISASAVGYYGDCGEAIVEDDSPPGADFLAQLCRDWEAVALNAAACGTRVFIPRFGIVLGSGGGVLARMIAPFRLGLGGPIGSGRQYIPWIHLQDLADLIVRGLTDRHLNAPTIAAAPNPVTNRDFVRTLAASLRRPCVMAVPAIALKALLGEAAIPLLTGQRVRPRRLEEAGFAWRYATLDTALANLLQETR
jgi:uncharacterized protein (TIGR01777 family)